MKKAKKKAGTKLVTEYSICWSIRYHENNNTRIFESKTSQTYNDLGTLSIAMEEIEEDDNFEDFDGVECRLISIINPTSKRPKKLILAEYSIEPGSIELSAKYKAISVKDRTV